MSKQSIARYEQKYTKPDPKNLPVCTNCAHFVELKNERVNPYQYNEPATRKFCKLGNFVVQKMATCEKFMCKPKAA
jgi:hypothetical protein